MPTPRWIDTINAHLATDAHGAPKVNLELVARIFVTGGLNDTTQSEASVVDNDVNAAKVFVDLFEELHCAVGGISDVIFDDEEFVRGVGCSEIGETGCFACDRSNTFASCNHLLDGFFADTSGSTGDC